MICPERIDTPDDPRIAAYTRIRERDLTGRDGRFIVEGKVTLEVLLTRSRFAVESLFLCERRLGPLAQLLERVPEDVPVYTAPQPVMDAVAGFPLHRGVLACARKGAPLTAADVLAAPVNAGAAAAAAGPVVVAIGLSNHDNIGALFRNAAAFGARGVLLDGESGDPLYRKSIRVSAGTALWLPFAHGGTADGLLAALEAAGHTAWALTPRASAAPLWDMAMPDRLALILGAEGPGLPDRVIRAATPVRIPMAPGVDSVNVATAAAIALGRAFSRRG